MNEEEILFGAYAALPTLMHSDNPDVARAANAVNKAAPRIALWYLLLKVLSPLLAGVLVAYWLGMGLLLVATGLTGWPFLGLLVLGFFFPSVIILPKAPMLLRVIGGIALVIGAVAFPLLASAS